MMKRTVAMLIAAGMTATALFGTTAAYAEEKKSVGFVTFGLGGDFFQNLADTFVEKMNEEGWDEQYADGEFNPTTQIEAMENYVAMGMDEIVLWSVAPEAMDTVVADARKAGVKVIAFVAPTSEYDTLMVADNAELADSCAKLAAKWIDETFADAEDHSVPVAVFSCRTAETGVIQADELEDFIEREPSAKKYIRPFIGPLEFINSKKRYCLWLKDCPPQELRAMPLVKARVAAVRDFRLASKKLQTQRRADIPHLFAEDRQPDSNYILFPRTSSERRRYLPIGFLSAEVIAGDTIILPDATLYHFGVLTSNVHNAWMRVVCGRMKSDYRYSSTLVYNNLPWPNPTEAQRMKIEQTAQAILDARALYPESSLADLYDEVTMPPVLRKAHQENDRAVMEAYGWKASSQFTESKCVAELFKLYQGIINI